MAKILFYLFLISIPFGTRTIIHQFTPAFDEYRTIFLYASDILLTLFLLFTFRENPKIITTAKPPIILFLFFAFLSIFFAYSAGLAVYSLIRLILLVLMAFSVGRMVSDKKVFEKTLAIIAVLAVIQSLLGFTQFSRQENLGLQILGESPIGADQIGTSKVALAGGELVRAYGTFPHPNVLAAFLLLGLLAFYYFWIKRPSEWKIFSSPKNLLSDLIVGLGIFIIAFGLLLTFSRTAWAIATFSTIIIALWSLLKGYLLQGVRLTILVLAILAILFLNFRDFIVPRLQVSKDESAVSLRLAYSKLGLNLIKENPLGVGIGNQVPYSVKSGLYQKFGLTESWAWQPIHNLYLLMASEVGIPGLFAFAAFLISLFLKSKSKIQMSNKVQMTKVQKAITKFESLDFEIWISGIMLLALLLFGLSDHFLWTIHQGSLMLWLAIGLTLSNILYYNTQYENRS